MKNLENMSAEELKKYVDLVITTYLKNSMYIGKPCILNDFKDKKINR